MLIAHPSECDDGTVQWRLITINVSIAKRKIGAKRGKYQLHQFRMIEDFRRSAVEPTQPFKKFVFRQITDPLRIREMWSRTTGHEQITWLDSMHPAQLPGQFETHQCPNAVTEKDERPIQIRFQRLA